MITSIQNTVKTLLLCSFFFSLSCAFAQAPQKISYQAVIRNASNALVANTNIGMRISVLQGTATGTLVYSETQTTTTNANGLATLEIGAGTPVIGTFASIAWGSNAYFIKTETDPTGGTNYTIVGTSQFLSVPYALFASNSGAAPSYWTAFGDNIRNNNIGKVGIGTGTDVPFSKFTVRQDGTGITQENANGTTRFGVLTGGVSAWLQTLTNSDLNFATNDNPTPQMTLQKATGNFGIGTATPTEKLDVAGKTKTTTLQVTTGAGAGKVLTSDAIGNATWTTPASSTGVVNQSTRKICPSFSTTTQGDIVDLPQTDIVVPASGFYLITYFMSAHNTFILSCANPCSSPRVTGTFAHLYNKTGSGFLLQSQSIDFLDQDTFTPSMTSTTNYSLPSHEISGSVVEYLTQGDIVGFKIQSYVSASGITAPINGNTVVTLVRLY